MAYEGHIAGVGDRPPGKRLQGRVIECAAARARRARSASAARRSSRRCREVAELEFVNGGGTGSLARTTASEDAVTELAAGSGFFAPTLFDAYSAFRLRPAAMFAMPVVRKPVAVDRDRARRRLPRLGRRRAEPRPLPPPARRPAPRPLRGRGRGADAAARRSRARACAIGDRVYFRHAKAGELCERFDSLHLVSGDRVVDEVPDLPRRRPQPSSRSALEARRSRGLRGQVRSCSTISAGAFSGDPASKGGWGSYSITSWIVCANSSPAIFAIRTRAMSMPDETPRR